MRHGCKVNKLSRTHAHRAAMLSNMASSLILHKRIETTLAKADSTHQRRMVFSYLQNKEAVKELFGDVATKVANRPGGYTRILKLGRRMGDGAEMVMMELVDYNEAMLKETTAKKAKTTRRGGKKKATETVEAPAQETVAEETKAE